MIAIINKGGNPFGTCHYEVKLNNEHLAYFDHFHPDGIAKCLQLAAKAVEKTKWLEAADFLTDKIEE